MVRHAAFVVPFMFETSVRFLRAAIELPGVAVSMISADPLERFPEDIRTALAGHQQVGNALEPVQLIEAVRDLGHRLGPVDRLVGVLEQLQEPLAAAREVLELPGPGLEVARCFRDKSVMKDRLRAAGLPCAHHQLVTSEAEAHDFVGRIGLPVVVKPPDGAGAVNTFRVDDRAQLTQALATNPPHPNNPVLIEEFIVGEEHSFDVVFVDGQPVWSNISRYEPTPLEVMHNDWIQWCVLLPRDITGPEYDEIRRVGPASVQALGLADGLCHMEWFRRRDGSVAVSEVGARPPGAQFTSLMSWAHDTDMYAAWSRLVITDQFEPPERRYAVGAAYLRGAGSGHVKGVSGLTRAQEELGDLVVEVKLPKAGQPRSSSYEGEGYAILRHPETDRVAEALRRLVQIVRVELG